MPYLLLRFIFSHQMREIICDFSTLETIFQYFFVPGFILWKLILILTS